LLTTKEYDMSRTLNALNWTGYKLGRMTDKLVGDGTRDMRGAIPTGAAAMVAGLKGHRAFTGKKAKKPTTFEERVAQYMKDHPAK
jgi:hypothetical protein